MKTHKVAPKEFRNVPVVTGHHELDATIQRNHSQNMKNRLDLRDFTPNRMKLGDNVYGPKTSYGGHGDE